MRASRFVLFFFALLAFAPLALAGTIQFPPGTTIVDVTQSPYNADPTGVADSTAAIQLAVNCASQDGIGGDGIADDGTDDGWQDGISRTRPRVIYFPTGVYRITNSIVGPNLNDSTAGGLIILQGQSRTGSILRLDANATGFGDPVSPKPIFTNFIGNSTNNAFMNGVENLTFEVGAGNPGAIGLQFGDNNCGYVRGVTIRTTDPALAGAVGLHLSPGTSAANPTGIGLIQDVAIEGFAIGVDTTRGYQMPWVLDHVTLSGQTAAGILNADRPLSINALTSTNTVSALRSTGAAGHVVMVNSALSGGAADQPAIDLQAGYGFFRDIARSGYTTTLRVAGVDQATNLTTGEQVVGPILKLWDTNPSQSLDLPIVDASEVPWDADGDWAVVAAPTGNEITDTAALQSALSSGKSSIVLQPGSYVINATLAIGPSVRRILGNWSTLRLHLTIKNQDVPIFRLATSNHPAVIVEKLQGMWSDATAYLIHHESTADLILRDIFWVAGPVYRNTPGAGGRLFLENIHSLGGGQTPRENRPAFVFDHQQVWARQINPEMQHPHMINNGGSLWILGFKTGEQRGPVVITQNGGSTEILGGVQNMTYDYAPTDPENTTILEILNANVSAVLTERFEGLATAWGNNAFVARETRGSETRTLRPATVYRSTGNTTYSSPVPVRSSQQGSVVPLFVGYQTGAGISSLLARIQEGAASTPVFVVSRDTPFTELPLTLNYTVSGTAVAGTDYEAISGSVTIPVGQSTAEISVNPLAPESLAVARTLTLTLSPSAEYTLGTNTSATIEIVEDSLLAPGAVDAILAANTTNSATVTVFNPEATSATYTLSGITGVYSAEHRNLQTGDTVTLPANKSELFATKPLDDSLSSTLTLPFAFPFYGANYNSLKVSTNGFVTFETASYSSFYKNKSLPAISSVSSRAMIAAYWDDLYLDTASKVWHASVDTDTDGQTDAWVIEFDNATTFATRNDSIPQRVSFQLWLLRDGTIRVTYTDSTITAVSYTIGIQNWDRDQAINLVYDGSAPSSVPASPLPAPYRAQAGTTVLFHPPINWAALSTTSLNVPAGGQASFTINFNSANLAIGTFLSSAINLASDLTSLTLPISLEVSSGPAAPTGFQAVAAAYNQINLSWNDVANETGYRIERSPDGVNSWTLLAEVAANTTAYSDTALSPETTWFYRVRAFNANGESSWAATVQATTPQIPTAPTAASNLAATLLSSNSVQLSWNDNSNNETGFRIERSTDGGLNFSTLTVVSVNTTTFLDSGLSTDITFTYRAVATNAVGDAPASNTASATTQAITTLLTGDTATWWRGRTGSIPASSVTLNGNALALFAGGANSAIDTQTPVWAHFPAVTLADGETLRLRATVRVNGSTPSIGQGFSLGLVNTNGTKTISNVTSNNPAERRNDGGYGFTFGLGGSTTTRYIHKPAVNDANGPWGNIDNSTNTLVLGATPATTTLNAETSVAFVLDLTRQGASLAIKVTLDGALYDAGRTVATVETFTYDSVALVLRREALSVTLTDLTVERLASLTELENWRVTYFGVATATGDAADLADPDGDGLPNLIEYALGGLPDSASSRPLPTAAISSNHLMLNFTPQQTAGLSFVVEASSDLSDWSDQTNLTDFLTPDQPYTHTDSADLAIQPKRFLRLRIGILP